jgi:hypothetical protein
MKKWLLISGAIAVLILLYLLIPRTVTFSTTMTGHRGIAAADRCFMDTSKWAQWWPKASGHSYQITQVLYNDMRVSIRCADGSSLNGAIRLAPMNGDSVLIGWEGSGSAGHVKEAQKNIEAILGSFKTFIEDAKNIYGVDFYRTMSDDFSLVTITTFAPAYPATAEVYSKIDSLRAYIGSQGAKEMNPPMLNVSRLGDTSYRIMVAISVDRKLTGKGRIIPKGFVPWKMLEGEVHGGVYTVERAFVQMQQYKADYNISIMALPFQSLITDRRQQQDTTKWVTKVCAPIS